IREAVRALGLDVRCGVHTGECELVGKDLAGIAVHIGARVAALAGSGEVLVSQTVRDLVAGSGLSFNERGKHRLRGFLTRGAYFKPFSTKPNGQSAIGGECPLRVASGDWSVSTHALPPKATSRSAGAISALCQKRTW